MRPAIRDLSDELLAEVHYLNAARGGGSTVGRLPIQRATLSFTGGARDGQRGNGLIGEALEAGDFPLAICGHDHWEHPLSSLPRRGQVLNVDARCVVLVIERG